MERTEQKEIQEEPVPFQEELVQAQKEPVPVQLDMEDADADAEDGYQLWRDYP